MSASPIITPEYIADAYAAETPLATTPEIETGTENATRRINPAVLNAAISAIAQGLVNALVNAAPGALDTLDELAAALGDDANFAATVTTALAGKYGAGSSPLFVDLSATGIIKSADPRGVACAYNDTYFTAIGVGGGVCYTRFAASKDYIIAANSSYAAHDGSGNGMFRIFGATGNVRIGYNMPYDQADTSGVRLYVDGNHTASGDIEALTIAKGIILKSPDGTRYRVTMANGGTLAIGAV